VGNPIPSSWAIAASLNCGREAEAEKEKKKKDKKRQSINELTVAVPGGTLTSIFIRELGFTILESSSEVSLGEHELVPLR